MKLIELAERCEGATGHGRELDNAILQFVTHLVGAARFWNHDDSRVRADDPMILFTASVDAALLLVPDGWSWSLGEKRGIGKFKGWLNDHNTPDGLAVRHVDAYAATPALAICAAALRAIAGEGE